MPDIFLYAGEPNPNDIRLRAAGELQFAGTCTGTQAHTSSAVGEITNPQIEEEAPRGFGFPTLRPVREVISITGRAAAICGASTATAFGITQSRDEQDMEALVLILALID